MISKMDSEWEDGEQENGNGTDMIAERES